MGALAVGRGSHELWPGAQGPARAAMEQSRLAGRVWGARGWGCRGDRRPSGLICS